MQLRATTLLLCVALLAVLGVGWGWRRSIDADSTPLQRRGAPDTTTSALRPAALAPAAEGPGAEAPETLVTSATREALTSSVVEPDRSTTPLGEIAQSARPFDLEVHFRGPGGDTLSLASVRVELTYPSGERHEVSATWAANVRISGITPGEAQLLVHAPDHSHWAQRVTLDPSEAQVVRGGARVQSVTATVWPKAWVAVIVETPKGEPFTELAAALGLPAQPLFANAFHARVSAIAPSHAEPEPPHNPALATFRGAPGHKAYVIGERAVGSLELLRDPPLWVGLEVYGALLRWEPLVVNAREVRFVLSPEDVDAGLARLELVVVERGTHTPIEGARGGIRADSSAARRGDHSEVTSAADGKLTFTRVVPGRYELWIERGEAQHQDYIELARGERRDLGRIELGSDIGIELEVVDGAGAPAGAYVEVGNYAPGLRPIEMYPQMIRHSSNKSGRVRVPSRAGLMVARAAVEVGRSNAPSNVQEIHGVRSPHVVVDPTNLPSAPIRLVLTEPVRVTIATTHVDAARIDVLDSAEVVIARKSGAREVSFEALPGPHRVRIYDTNGAQLRDVALELVDNGQHLQVD
jgi:hypothetical protein